MTATIVFEVAKAEDVLIVPNAALRFDPQAARPSSTDWRRPARAQPMQPRVYLLDNAQQLVEVPVELGLTNGSSTAVQSAALKEGDHVVIEQQAHGGPVRLTPQRTPRI